MTIGPQSESRPFDPQSVTRPFGPQSVTGPFGPESHECHTFSHGPTFFLYPVRIWLRPGEESLPARVVSRGNATDSYRKEARNVGGNERLI